ncbi:MAG TPA: guanitoxin biosynthesis L-enduracididine beta-hydroxylase GntD [Pyrinomonadaceae bacterium]|nr:guanitoxin biosynthesis L-enduracididine beta-hydroxylase GntD [Pyrinomonadaceae bacterium]
MNQLTLSNNEVSSINGILVDLSSRYHSADDPEFLRRAPFFAHNFPNRVRAFLHDFRTMELPSGIGLISGYPIDEWKIGRTPKHWKCSETAYRTLEEEMLLILFGSLLGEPLGWATQQDGHVIHDVLPIEGHEHEQLGSSSQEFLTWHVEDAFHPHRCDYLGMMCLRNRQRVATNVASIDSISLSPEEVEILFQPRFTIWPDESHLRKNRSNQQNGGDDQLDKAYENIERMKTNPEKLAVLFGDQQSPYIRLDPYFMQRLENDEEGQAALDSLVQKLDEKIHDLVLEAGDFVFIDNYRVVHGRKPFVAKYDGTDRWLKRINLARDLRKSRAARLTADSRIIY